MSQLKLAPRSSSPRPDPGPVREIELDQVRVWSLHNRRNEFLTDERVAGLARQLQSVGQQQPALGRYAPDGHTVELIYGRRRLAAARLAGLKFLRVEIVDISDAQALQAMEAENAEREDLSDYEKGLHYQRLVAEGHFAGVTRLCQALALDRRKVTRQLSLTSLPAELIQAIGSPYAMPLTTLERLAGRLGSAPDRGTECLEQAQYLRAQGRDERTIIRALNAALRRKPKQLMPRTLVFRKNGRKICEMRAGAGGDVKIDIPAGDYQRALVGQLKALLRAFES